MTDVKHMNKNLNKFQMFSTATSLVNIVIDKMTNVYRERQRACVNNTIDCEEEDEKEQKFIHHWMDYISQSSVTIKRDFIEKLIEKENTKCSIVYHIKPVGFCKKCYTSFTLLNDWEKWHKPLFVQDRIFFSQILMRYINHCENSHEDLSNMIENQICAKIENYSKELRTISTVLEYKLREIKYEFPPEKIKKLKEDKKKIENEIFIIIKYVEFLSNLGIHTSAFMIIKNIFVHLYKAFCNEYFD